ncbi:hypothetical protein RP20_CCG020174 [Aedes albopictus]|nr:uncharacterized protein LOC109403808 [Aedes albopictus]XP_029731212.1 uncharacterized protein LOC109403808 [Aedes albopictus]KXJ71613.1 hypothetical protein RP20_CCG020174 [Aedes albopictus]
MACKILVLIIVILIDLVRTAPTWYNYESWNNGPDLTYKDYLKKVGAYPRIFRYGTHGDPVYQTDYNSWFDPVPSYQQTSSYQQYDGNSWWQNYWNQPGYLRYDDSYEQYAQQQAQQMERDVSDILWQW